MSGPPTTSLHPPATRPAPAADAAISPDAFTPTALRLLEMSSARWGTDHAVEIVGRSPLLESQLQRLEKVANFREPVLILGESGVGKECFARALHLLGRRSQRPFVSVNCPQYGEGNLTVSELFGHKRGSFTGAVADRKGAFETAEGGVIFLDEIADLFMSAQVMLLRALSTGEFQPLGATATRRLDVRIVAATNRPLNAMVAQEQFRRDLLFRLRYFLVEIPPLRDRGEDWRLLLEHFLQKLQAHYGAAKRFSEESLGLLAGYNWPGNVRELISIATTGYALSDDDLIEPRDFVDRLEQGSAPSSQQLGEIQRQLSWTEGDFWTLVREPFLNRELNRGEVRQLVARGLREAQGSYRSLLERWRLPADQYQKFMDFLRHHNLKPRGFRDEEH
ncbi:MAG: sigma 54-interacting transcriptional regulator [Acidobacteriota bacterium]